MENPTEMINTVDTLSFSELVQALTNFWLGSSAAKAACLSMGTFIGLVSILERFKISVDLTSNFSFQRLKPHTIDGTEHRS